MILSDKLKDGINRFLEKHSFEIQFPLDFEGSEYANVTVKVHLIDIKHYKLNGNWTTVIISSNNKASICSLV
jgi:hypothetical protein